MSSFRSLVSLTAVVIAVAACSATTSSAAAPSLAPPSVAAPSVTAPATPSPTPIPTATPLPTPTARPAPTATPPKADVHITAQDVRFTTPDVTAPDGKAFTIAFQNQDAGIPHNVHITVGAGASIFKGALVTGPATTIYKVPVLTAGIYRFICDVHPLSMVGTITVR
jgi:plastocyanin